ncbi:DNA repair protein RecO C-terminal domain-containing protein [Reinekea forsetii]|nr:DNA repair protein RecO C-terminal domain-containing protein [Reinekea forsetii]
MAVRASVIQGFLVHAQAIEEQHFMCALLSPTLGLIRCKFHRQHPEFFRQFEIKLKETNQFYSCHDFRYTQALLIDSSPARLYGLYLNELVYRLVPTQVDMESFFGTYISTLIQLQADNHRLANLRFFEKQLLVHIGMGIDYLMSVNGAPIHAQHRYHFEAGQGFSEQATGAFKGEAILANARSEYEVKGALATARECQHQQLLMALDNEPILSREWLKTLPVPSEANK